jgi:hypothetical protein
MNLIRSRRQGRKAEDKFEIPESDRIGSPLLRPGLRLPHHRSAALVRNLLKSRTAITKAPAAAIAIQITF